jgi:hypothetical protein
MNEKPFSLALWTAAAGGPHPAHRRSGDRPRGRIRTPGSPQKQRSPKGGWPPNVFPALRLTAPSPPRAAAPTAPRHRHFFAAPPPFFPLK